MVIYLHFYTVLRLCIEYLLRKEKLGAANTQLLCSVKKELLSVEGHTIGTLLGSGIVLMGAHHDLLQRAIILGTAMILALIYGTLNATVCTTLMMHSFSPPVSDFGLF